MAITDVSYSIYIRHNENKELAVFFMHRLLLGEEPLSSLHGGPHFSQRT